MRRRTSTSHPTGPSRTSNGSPTSSTVWSATWTGVLPAQPVLHAAFRGAVAQFRESADAVCTNRLVSPAGAIDAFGENPDLYAWYAAKAAENRWAVRCLNGQIDLRLHERQGAALTNFPRRFSSPETRWRASSISRCGTGHHGSRRPNVPPKRSTAGGARARAWRGSFERGLGSVPGRVWRPRGDGIPPAEMLRETPR
jgi:hypothetical protein